MDFITRSAPLSALPTLSTLEGERLVTILESLPLPRTDLPLPRTDLPLPLTDWPLPRTDLPLPLTDWPRLFHTACPPSLSPGTILESLPLFLTDGPRASTRPG